MVSRLPFGMMTGLAMNLLKTPSQTYLVNQPQASVAETWGQQGWNLNFRRPLNDWEVTRAIEFYKLLDDFKGIVGKRTN